MLRYRLNPFNALDMVQAVHNILSSSIFNEEEVHQKKETVVNVFEQDGDQILQVEVPGFRKEDLKIEVKDNQVTITGERADEKTDETKVLHSERAGRKVSRSFKLPYQIDAETVTAELKLGILTLKLPKAESEKPREIVIS